MPITLDRDWEGEFYEAVCKYLEGEGNSSTVEVKWNTYHNQKTNKPRLGFLSGRIREIMEEDYSKAESGDQKRKVLEDVKHLLEDYHHEINLDNVPE